MITLFAFVVVLGILIFFHELGHFLVARACGVGVEKFSLGFGPRLFGKKSGRTDYRVSAIPLGGYVKMVGEDPDAEIEPEDVEDSFTHKPVFKRILIVAAGPFFNFILAIIIFYGIFQISGTMMSEPVVGEVKKGAPAEEAGLMEGDRIAAIDGLPIETWTQMAQIISDSQGGELSVTIQRDGNRFIADITPRTVTTKNIFGEDTNRYIIGITSAGKTFTKALNPIEAMGESLYWTYKISELTVVSIAKIIQGSISAKTIGGPIMIAQMAGKQAEEGPSSLIFFIAVLSINLGVLNLLPIPILDGGHLVFFFIEAAIGRPVNTRMREIAQQVGLFILILLMIFVFYNDITRVFFDQNG